MMELETVEIDRIVREVVQRLNGIPAAAAPAIDDSRVDSATLVFDQPLVTTNSLEGRLQGIRRLKIRPDAVVTPLVKDLLRESSVELIRDAARPQARRVKGCLFVECDWNTAQLVDRLCQSGLQWRQLSSWPSLLEELSAVDALAVVCTSQWAARVCEANRHESIRAIHAVDVGAVRDAARQIEVNMLVIDATRRDEGAAIEMANCLVELSAS